MEMVYVQCLICNHVYWLLWLYCHHTPSFKNTGVFHLDLGPSSSQTLYSKSSEVGLHSCQESWEKEENNPAHSPPCLGAPGIEITEWEPLPDTQRSLEAFLWWAEPSPRGGESPSSGEGLVWRLCSWGRTKNVQLEMCSFPNKKLTSSFWNLPALSSLPLGPRLALPATPFHFLSTQKTSTHPSRPSLSYLGASLVPPPKYNC